MKKPMTLSLLAVLCVVAAPAFGSTAAGQAPASDPGKWQAPRTPDGHPDLQGNWTNMSLTPFEREVGRRSSFTWEEVEEMERPSGDCPPDPRAVECGRELAESGSNEVRLRGQEYNEVYWSPGTRVAIVDGEPRTSLVTNPADGRIPSVTQEGERRIQEAQDLMGRFGPYDHPELRPLGERCIISGSTGGPAGPPMVPKTSYNGNYTIVQTADHVMIIAEMVHDARIIRIGDGPRLPPHVRPWLGDSWGWWDGDALVVETTNIHPEQTLLGVPPSEHMRVTERFTRVDEETILYEFTVEDPTIYTQTWGGQIPIKKFDDMLYEYACHEANYGMIGILSGARYEERMEGR